MEEIISMLFSIKEENNKLLIQHINNKTHANNKNALLDLLENLIAEI